jgi:hypothetical protein
MSDEFTVFDTSSNYVVTQHKSRSFPGVLLQGDTLKIFYDSLSEAKDSLLQENTHECLLELDALKQRFLGILIHYERVLSAHGHRLPYTPALSPKSISDLQP